VNSYADSAKQTEVIWGYTGDKGPHAWGTLDPAFKACAVGKQQSPININTQEVIPTKNEDLDIDYRAAVPLNIVSDGITELNIGGHREIINDGHTLQVNFPQTGKLEFIEVKEKHFRLVQFHIHTPSETHLDGKSYPLEIHFVNQGNNGKVAVIGVFVQSGKFNPAIETLLRHLPPTQGQIHPVPGVKLNLLALLPKNESHYSFPGSLTTPPCTEGLQWFVMANPIEASEKQITELKKALPLSHNARPIQPLHGRKVLFFSEK
ncbi:MAG: carbonic anhydrase family protein, partial [Gammaproteobacteria bacterium]